MCSFPVDDPDDRRFRTGLLFPYSISFPVAFLVTWLMPRPVWTRFDHMKGEARIAARAPATDHNDTTSRDVRTSVAGPPGVRRLVKNLVLWLNYNSRAWFSEVALGAESTGAVMKRFDLLGAAIATFLAVPASAADMRMPVKAPPPVVAPVFTWTGCYVGINGGAARNRVDVTTSIALPPGADTLFWTKNFRQSGDPQDLPAAVKLAATISTERSSGAWNPILTISG
jgi:hypothetical protein